LKGENEEGEGGGVREIRVNGLGSGYSRVFLALHMIAVSMGVAVFLTIAQDWRDMVIFMGAGDRCTAGDCSDMKGHLALIDQIIEEALDDYDADQDRIAARFAAHDVECERSHTSFALEDQRLQRQIDRIEDDVFFGKKKPDLQPYGEN
jgi:hypothetical protein